MDFPILFFLLLYTLQYSDGNSSLIEPKCSDASGKVRCCAGYRTISRMCQECIGSFGFECSRQCHEGFYGKQCNERCQCKLCNITSGECVNDSTDASNEVATKAETEFPWLILVGILCSIIMILIVFLVATVQYKRKLLYSRPYQEECVTTDTVSLGYASVENNTYLECSLSSHTEISEDSLKHNQLEENKTNETGSGHYLSVHPKPPSNADVWKSIKETVEKNRERNNMLRLLSRRYIPPNTSHRCSYVSVVEQTQSCKSQIQTKNDLRES